MDNDKFQRLNDQANMLIQFARQSELFNPYFRGYLNGLITIANLYQNTYISFVTENDILFQKLKGGV